MSISKYSIWLVDVAEAETGILLDRAPFSTRSMAVEYQNRKNLRDDIKAFDPYKIDVTNNDKEQVDDLS